MEVSAVVMNPAPVSSQPGGRHDELDPPPETRLGHHGATAGLRRMVLGALVLVLAQAGIGMNVNLYVTIPARHPGSHPSNYVSGSFHGVAWAVAHGALALAIHASLGLLLVVMVIIVAVRALTFPSRAVRVWSVLAGLLVVGAGFNGASFLDFGNAISSLIMALLALGAVACYSVALFFLASSA